MPSFLTQEQVDKFHRDGCLIVPNFLSKEEVEQGRLEISNLIQDFDLEKHPKTTFSTGEDQVGEAYFLTSSDKVRYFLEESAIKDGKLIVPKEHSVNKIGHALHLRNQFFKSLTAKKEMKQIANDVGFKDCRVLQSMLILKPPKTGGEVTSHQDSTFLYTDPPSAMGLWIPFDDCNKSNGCLYFAPGSHKTHPLHKRFVRKVPFQYSEDGELTESDKAGTIFVPLGPEPRPDPPENEWVAAEIPAGTLVMIHGSVLHKSSPNTSDKGRNAYTFHMVEGDNHIYDELNWLQRSKDMPEFTKLNEMTA